MEREEAADDSDVSSTSDHQPMDNVEDDEDYIDKSTDISASDIAVDGKADKMTLRNRAVPKISSLFARASKKKKAPARKWTRKYTPESEIDHSTSLCGKIRAEKTFRKPDAIYKLPRSQCLKCQKTMLLHNAEAHFRIYHLDQPGYACPACDTKFTVLFNAKRHVREVHDLDRSSVIDITHQFVDNFKQLFADSFVRFNDHLKPKSHKRPRKPKIIKPPVVKIHKVNCQLCGEKIMGPVARREHTLFHLNEPQMFSCNLCDFSHAWDKRQILEHARTLHTIGIVLFSKERELSAKIVALENDCFT